MSVVEYESATRSVGMQELSFQVTRKKGNPFARPVWASIQGPSGDQPIHIPAFHDGSDIWRIRFTPRAAGLHRVTAILEGTNPESAVPLSVVKLSRDAFHVDAVPPHGFIRRSSSDTQRFQFDDGNPYFPIGYNHAWGPEQSFPFAFQKMKSCGLNWSRVWMNYWTDLNLDWVRGRSVEPGNIDLRVARRWDSIVQAAEDNGIAIQMVLQHHGQFSTTVNPNWDVNPWNKANGGWLEDAADFFTDEKAREITRAKYRYIVARWGYSPAIMAWELFNEVEFTDGYIGAELVGRWHDIGKRGLFDFQSGREVASLYARRAQPGSLLSVLRMEQFDSNIKSMNAGNQQSSDFGLGRHVVSDWHSEMAATIRSVDTHKHLITTSSVPIDSPIWSAMDYYQPHVYRRDMIEPVARLPRSPESLGKPVFIAEMGDHSIIDPAKEDGRYMHSMMWAGLFSGAAGAAQVWAWDRVAQWNLFDNYRVLTDFIAQARIACAPFARTHVSFHPSPAPAGESIRPSAYAIASTHTIALWICDLKSIPTPQGFPISGVVHLEPPAGWNGLAVTWINTRNGMSIGPRANYRQWPASLQTPRFVGDVAAIITNIESQEFRRSTCARN